MIKTLLKLWEQLSETEIDVREQVLLLTENNNLLPASQVLIPDAPWRIEGVRHSNFAQLLHPQLYESCSAIAKYAESPSLAKDVMEEYQNFQQNQQAGAQLLCQEWQEQIRSREFQIGLSRLILDEHGLSPEELPDLFWLNQTRIFPANAIYTNLYWNGNLIAEAVPGDYYFSALNQTFYIRFDRDDVEVVPGYFATCLNYQLGESFSLKMHLGILEDLLDIMPARISNILDKKRILEYLPTNPSVQSSEAPIENTEISIFGWKDEPKFDDDDELVDVLNGQPVIATKRIQIVYDSIDSEDDIITPEESLPIAQVNVAQPQSLINPDVEDDWSQLPEYTEAQSSDSVSDHLAARHHEHRTIPSVPVDTSVTRQPIPRAIGGFRQRLKSYGPANRTTLRVPVVQQQRATGRRSRSQNSQKPRLLTYVSSQATAPSSDHDQQVIEQAGMARVLAYEQLQGRIAKDMNDVCTNHPGYDVESIDRHGNKRYIEVKAKRGVWDNLGVKMTQMQFHTALDNQNNFWLYVVEQAEDEQKFKIYMIQNPAGRVDEFFYDVGWKDVADEQFGG